MGHETPAEDRPRDADRQRDPANDAARSAELDERQRQLDSREAYQNAVRDDRDRQADKRDRSADQRDRDADARQQQADQREARADQRELAALEPFMQPEKYGADTDAHRFSPRPSPPRRTRDPRPPHDPGEP